MDILQGQYRDVSMSELREYGNVPPEFEKIINSVYQANNRQVPLDILASIMGTLSYDRFIRNYVKANEASANLLYGDITRQMDIEIQDFEFPGNMRSMFEFYNIVPFKVTENSMEFIIPEKKVHDFNKPEFILFRRTVAEALGGLGRKEIIRGCSNLMFMEGLRMVTNKKPFTEKDLIYLPEQKLNKMFIDAVLMDATDVYIDPKEFGYNISFSIFNDEVPYRTLKMNKVEKREIYDGILKLTRQDPDKATWATSASKDRNIPNLADLGDKFEGRVNMINTAEGLAPVIRIHRKDRTVQTLEELTINEEPKRQLRNIIQNPSGILLVAGATGQGKSTTIYSCLDTISKTRPRDRIEEISNPVEVAMDNVSQLSLDEDRAIDFDTMEDAQTRRNAKIIFLGEVNTVESTRFAVNLAMQEKLLLSTIHAEAGALVPSRIQGMTIQDPGAYYHFLELVRGITHQKMLKLACPDCSIKVDVETLAPTQLQVMRAFGYDLPEILRVGNDPNCPTCNGTGEIVNKPIVCVEVIEIDDTLRDKIVANRDNPRNVLEEHMKTKGGLGVQDAIRYLKEDKLTFDQIWRRYALWNTRTELIL